VGYSTFQLPSQMILHKVGAPMWLAVIVTIWGITAACMASVTNEQSFYIVRLVLGFAEAGSFPGYWYYLTLFYPDKHITIPFTITDSAIMIAQVRLRSACNQGTGHVRACCSCCAQQLLGTAVCAIPYAAVVGDIMCRTSELCSWMGA
jgi:hypothetical protein